MPLFRLEWKGAKPLLRQVQCAAHIMFLCRDTGKEQFLLANQNRWAGQLRQQPVIVPASLSKAISRTVKGKAGDHSKFDLLCAKNGAVGVGFKDAVSAALQIIKRGDLAQCQTAVFNTARQAEAFSLQKGCLKKKCRVDFMRCAGKGQKRMCALILRQ